jgi:hypothetical protein
LFQISIKLDVASRKYRFVMRIVLAAAVASASLFPALAFAQEDYGKTPQPSRMACREYARAIADEWSSVDIARIEDDTIQPGADEVVVIAAGKKYFVPREQTEVVATSVGKRIRAYHNVYREEFRRCLRGSLLNISAPSN